MDKEAKLTVVSEKDAKKEQFEKQIVETQKQLDEVNDRIKNRGYLVEGGEKTGKHLITWLTTNAAWKFTEALGVIESIKQINSALEDIAKGKTKELMLPNLALEAVYYFISKQEGKGLAEANEYHETLLKPVADALGRAKVDKDKVNTLEFNLASLQQGISVDETETEN
jgi:glutaredoxin 2